MKFTQIPANTFKELQLNAGVLLKEFTPSTAQVGADAIIGATTGGISFTAVPTYSYMGEDIDNCPKNMKELKKLDSWEIKLSGTFVSVSTANVKSMIGAADIDTSDSTKIVPRNDIKAEDFTDLWWVGDYSDKNGATNGGYMAVHMMNTLSTGGLSIQLTDKAKGQFAFEYTAHYSIEAQGTVPFEVYVKAGTAESV